MYPARSLVRSIGTTGSALLACTLLASLPTPAAETTADARNWPQFRGPGGVGVAPASAGPAIPREWNEQTILWKTAIPGLGHSSPIVWGDRIFLTTAIEGEAIPGAQAPVHTLGGQEFKHPDAVGADKEHTLQVLALEAATGKILWTQTSFQGRVFDDRHRASSYASPTPVTDGERVYAYFGSEGTYAYDFAGKLVWSRDIGDIKAVGLGVASSPVLWRDLLLVQADEDSGEASFIVALDRRTGAEVWRKPRPVQVSWTTPTLIAAPDGTEQLLTAGNEYLIAYDPASGSELWRTKGLDSNAIHTPLQSGSTVVFSAGYPKKNVLALELPKQGDLTGGEPFSWTYDKGTAYVPSNLIYDGLLYLVNDSGILTCLDARTGELVYEGGRPAEQGRFTASPTLVDGAILLISRDGDATFVKPGRQHEILASTSIDEPVAASPAVAGGRLYVRGEQHLYAIGAR
ncbi:MAG TPA: PQQ-binding-like beta-propeller repeat protein [Thermoanaerobaculia bacterium]|nr:PQQ-binding-like beta-propeller repeat protein [Thermoanaerobaculia bacterium]